MRTLGVSFALLLLFAIAMQLLVVPIPPDPEWIYPGWRQEWRDSLTNTYNCYDGWEVDATCNRMSRHI